MTNVACREYYAMFSPGGVGGGYVTYIVVILVSLTKERIQLQLSLAKLAIDKYKTALCLISTKSYIVEERFPDIYYSTDTRSHRKSPSDEDLDYSSGSSTSESEPEQNNINIVSN